MQKGSRQLAAVVPAPKASTALVIQQLAPVALQACTDHPLALRAPIAPVHVTLATMGQLQANKQQSALPLAQQAAAANLRA